MQIQAFKIRIADEFINTDQQFLNHFLNRVKFKKSTAKLVESGEQPFWSVLVHYEQESNKDVTTTNQENSTQVAPKSAKQNNQNIWEQEFDEREQLIIDTLRKWRTDLSREDGIPAYTILSNKSIIAIAKDEPIRLGDFEHIHGFGEIKTKQHGETILALLDSV